MTPPHPATMVALPLCYRLSSVSFSSDYMHALALRITKIILTSINGSLMYFFNQILGTKTGFSKQKKKSRNVQT